jgi:hypothetical protein
MATPVSGRASAPGLTDKVDFGAEWALKAPPQASKPPKMQTPTTLARPQDAKPCSPISTPRSRLQFKVRPTRVCCQPANADCDSPLIMEIDTRKHMGEKL